MFETVSWFTSLEAVSNLSGENPAFTGGAFLCLAGV
jgi:hypothetical protein